MSDPRISPSVPFPNSPLLDDLQPSPSGAPLLLAPEQGDSFEAILSPDAVAVLSGRAGVVKATVLGLAVTDGPLQGEISGGVASGQIGDDDHSNVRTEVGTFTVHQGYLNKDGSVGGNFGLQATAVGVEGTVEHSGNSVTGGLSLGAGAAASLGTRDADHDGSSEACFRLSALFFTVGACVENPF